MWGGPPDIDTYEAAIANYREAFPDVEIELVDAAGCGASYAACKTLIAGGTMADVFVPGSWNYNAMANDGVLEDLTPLIESDPDLALEDFHPVTVEAVTSLRDGQVVGLPMGFNIQSLWYNKDMFDAAGLAYPPSDGDYTWDDVRDWATQLTLDGEPATRPRQQTSTPPESINGVSTITLSGPGAMATIRSSSPLAAVP